MLHLRSWKTLYYLIQWFIFESASRKDCYWAGAGRGEVKGALYAFCFQPDVWQICEKDAKWKLDLTLDCEENIKTPNPKKKKERKKTKHLIQFPHIEN